MKKVLLWLCFLLLASNLLSRQLMHAYYGNFKEAMRVVFVFRTDVHYNTLLDTDNRLISIYVNNAVIASGFNEMDFTNNPLISGVEVETVGNNLRINISTHIVYYAETFFLKERFEERPFKIVVDIFRQKEPSTIEMAREYIIFYDTVGYKDRADALRRRISRNDFRTTPIYFDDTPTTPPPPPPPPVVITPPPSQIFTTPSGVRTFDESQMLENPLLYLKPDDTYLTDLQRMWMNEAFRLYDLFKNIHLTIEQAERILRLYDTQIVVNISFVDTMSKSYNSLSNINITINEIRLQFNNALQRENFPSNPTIEYTRVMINHVLRLMDSYQRRANDVQAEYDKRINR